MGHAEQANAALEALVRTICARLKEKYGREISSRDSILPWVLRHAG